MNYNINDTTEYHINDINSLGWELTVCNAMEDNNSPIRNILGCNTFGSHLNKHFHEHLDFSGISRILEVGGGYGYLMRDLITLNQDLQSYMLDISSFLLSKQMDTLKDFNTDFQELDFFKTDNNFLASYDLVILNENIGDFPTISNIEVNIIDNNQASTDPVLTKIKNFFKRYSLQKPSEIIFNFNLGAAEAIEKLCKAGIKNIYVSEHSCESEVPDEYKDMIKITSPGVPEKINLKGHDEYTIKFSYLEKIAQKWGYTVIRGNYTDFIQFKNTPLINFIFTSKSQKDEHEIIRLFIEDLFKYEYLMLIKN